MPAGSFLYDGDLHCSPHGVDHGGLGGGPDFGGEHQTCSQTPPSPEQTKPEFFHFSIFGIVLDEMQQNTEDECSDLGQKPSAAIVSI